MAAVPRPDFRNPVHVLAFGLGAGLSPIAPGTAGTLLGVFIYLALAPLALPYYAATVTLLFLLGVWLCHRAAADLDMHDHPGIVFDEIVGFLVAMTALPRGWPWLIAGFVLFRLLDILKPWPIGPVDRRLKGGLGIMADDLVAGLMALGLLQLAYRLF